MIPLPEYYQAIVDLTIADNGPKCVTKALLRQDSQTLEQIVNQHLAQREITFHVMDVLTDEEKRARHKSGFSQNDYLFFRQLCFLVLAAHASLCLVFLGNDDIWSSINVLMEKEERKIPIEIVTQCVWGLLFRCHMDRTFYNGMQRALKRNEVSVRMVRTIYLGLFHQLFHFSSVQASEDE